MSADRAQLSVGSKIDYDAVFTCAQTRAKTTCDGAFNPIPSTNEAFRLKPCWCTKTRQTTDSNMSGIEGDDPKDDEVCETKRIGQNNKKEAELAIYYSPNEGRLDYLSKTSV